MEVLRYFNFLNETKKKPSKKKEETPKKEEENLDQPAVPAPVDEVPVSAEVDLPPPSEENEAPGSDPAYYAGGEGGEDWSTHSWKDYAKKYKDPEELLKILKKKKEVKPEDLIRWETPIESGDYVKCVDFGNKLNKDQKEYLRSRPFFYVRNVVDSRGAPYDVGEPHVEIGYKSPFKMSRFKKIDKTDTKYKVLFLQFDLPVDVHGEKDKENMFRGAKTMSGVFTKLFHEKLKDEVLVDFSNYDDVYKIRNDYYVNGIMLKNFDFVFFGHVSSFTSLCKLIVNYLERNEVPYLKYGTYHEFDNKAYEFHLLESLGYPYIPSVMATKLSSKVIKIVEQEFGFPVIVKDVTANRGTGVYKVEDMKHLIKTFSMNGRLMLIQKYIPNDGDFRVITIKNKVRLIIKKKRIDEKEFRSNVARGGKAIRATLPKDIINMCEDVSRHLDSDIIGFDIIQNKDNGEYYIMETNAASHFPTFAIVSGVNIPEIIVNYMIKKIKE